MSAKSERIFHCDHEVFRKNFNHLPHEVTHTLTTNPLFKLSALAELAQRIATRKNSHHPQGDIHVDQETVLLNREVDLHDRSKKYDISKLVEDIENGKTWIILKHIEREPGYRELFEDCICDILDLTGSKIVENIKWFEAILFITSPNRVTKYHIDRECSWLLQIQGNKDIHFFDRSDKDVLPDDELEQYWMFNDRFSAVYRPQYESRAIVYHMRPGTGVHSPVNTPHWLQNGNNVSVSLSINFQFHESAWENLFKANYYLRRVGLTPTPPGRNRFADRVKSSTYTAVQGVWRNGKGIPTTEARQHYHRIVKLLASR